MPFAKQALVVLLFIASIITLLAIIINKVPSFELFSRTVNFTVILLTMAIKDLALARASFHQIKQIF